MTVSTNHSIRPEKAAERERNRLKGGPGAGQFGSKAFSDPDQGAMGGIAIRNSPDTRGRAANLHITLPAGQTEAIDVYDARIGRQGERSNNGDTITFRRTEEGVRAVYEVMDDDVTEQFADAREWLEEEQFDTMLMDLRNEVRVRSFGSTDVFFQDEAIRFRHVSDHTIDDDDSFHTADVFDQLEQDRSYISTRDGVLFTSAYAVLRDYGFDDGYRNAA